MSKIPIHLPALSPICSACYNFTKDGTQQQRRTVIIAPIIITNEADCETIKTGWACSSGSFCQDPNCRYSRGATLKKRDSEEENRSNIEPL